MQTSLKLKTCSRFFIAFVKSTLNLEYFGKKYQFPSLSIMEIINCETGSHLNDQSHSLSITEIIKCETGSHLNEKKNIFHATLRQTTC